MNKRKINLVYWILTAVIASFTFVLGFFLLKKFLSNNPKIISLQDILHFSGHFLPLYSFELQRFSRKCGSDKKKRIMN